MDHIPDPNAGNSSLEHLNGNRKLEFAVPCLVSEQDLHIGQDFRSFPIRCDYNVDDFGRVTTSSLEEKSPEANAKFVQKWLYFGILRQVFGSDFHLEDFVAPSEKTSDGQRISTKFLNDLVQTKRRSLWVESGRVAGKWSIGSGRIENILRFAAAQVQFLDVDTRETEDLWADCIVITRLLLECLFSMVERSPPPGFVTLPELKSNQAIRKQIFDAPRSEAAWCEMQWRRMCDVKRTTTLIYIGGMVRVQQPWNQHGTCSLDSCIGYNLDDVKSAHIERHHYPCACAAAGSSHQLAVETPRARDVSRLDGQVLTENATVGQTHRDQTVQEPECRQRSIVAYTKAIVTCAAMTAISHSPVVVTNSLGLTREGGSTIEQRGPLKNKAVEYDADKSEMIRILKDGGIPLLRCKEEKDGTVSIKYMRASPETRYVAVSHLWADGLSASGTDLCQCQLRSLYRKISEAPTGTRSSRSVYIWLDVYCIPSRELAAREYKESGMDLKMLAIERMTAVYSWAKMVFVLDHELINTKSSTIEEGLGRIALCGWNTRYWTFQEYCLGKSVVFQRKDKCIGDNGLGILSSQREMKKGNVTERLLRRSLEHFLERRSPTFTWQHNRLSKTQSYKMKRVAHFVHVWNSLRKRETSQMDDILQILALMLYLSPAELSRLKDNNNNDADHLQQIQAILGSHPHLPVMLLFAVGAERPSRAYSWVPRGPHGAVRMLLPVHETCDIMEVTPQGLLISGLQHVQPYRQDRQVKAFNVTSYRGISWLVRKWPRSVGAESRKPVLITLHLCEEDKRILNAEPESQLVLLLHLAHRDLPASANPGYGACFQRLKPEPDCNTLHVRYLCPITCEQNSERVRAEPKLGRCDLDYLDAQIDRLLVRCCDFYNSKPPYDQQDIGSWPVLSIRRNDIPSHLDRCLVHYCAAVALTSLFVVWFGISRAGSVLLSRFVLFGFEPAVILAVPTLCYAYTYGRFLLHLQTLHPDKNPRERWWRLLADALPRWQRLGLVPPFKIPVVLFLKMICSVWWLASYIRGAEKRVT